MEARPKIQDIKLTDISPNDYNPQEMSKDKYQSLVNHIRAVGFQDPLKVRVKEEGADPDTLTTPYILVDGEHRLRAYMEVYPDSEEVTCAIMETKDGRPFSRGDAIISTIAFNVLHGEENPIKMGEAIRQAMSSGYMIEDIEDLTGMKKSALERFMEIDDAPKVSDNLPSFGDTQDEAGPQPKDPVIISFAVYPEQRETIDNAISKAKAMLPEGTDIDEERGGCLELIAKLYLKSAVA